MTEEEFTADLAGSIQEQLDYIEDVVLGKDERTLTITTEDGDTYRVSVRQLVDGEEEEESEDE